MRVDRKAPAERDPADVLPSGKSAPSGFALLAKRISSWTTKCVVSALILVAGLAFGRQVLDWWRADEARSLEPPPQLAMTDGLGDPARAHQLEFGDAPWAVTRKTVVGTRDEAAAALRGSCRELTIAGSLPDEAMGPSEQQFLTSLSQRSPVAEEPGRWQLYELEGGLPMVVGTRTWAAGSGAAQGEQVAGGPCRVVTWGLALPAPAETWTLYAFHPTASAAGLLTDLSGIPLPPNSAKTISMRASGGGAIVAFRGPLQEGSWRTFFDQWFRDHKWTPVGTWTRLDSTWHLRYARAMGHPTQTVDVQFGPDGRGGMTGLLMIAPADGKSTESESP